MNTKQRILDFFFPPRCPACGCILRSGEAFCASCFAALQEEKTPRFTHGQQLSFSRLYFVMDYSEKTKPAVRNLKEIPDSAEAAVLAEALASQIREREDVSTFSLATFVPMAGSKQKKRGHNQAETLCRLLALQLSIPFSENLLLREENTPSQHTLSMEDRRKNAVSAFRAAEHARISGRVLLVDDIATTGATLERCASLLIKMGASDVIAATAFATPPHRSKQERIEGSTRENAL